MVIANALLANAVNWASREANPLVVEAPLGVEVRAYLQGKRTVVQLLNYVSSKVRGANTAGGPAVEDAIPIHNIRFKLKVPVTRALLATSGQRLPIEHVAGRAIVVIPQLDVHEIVVLERADE